MWEEEQRAVNGEYLKTAAGTLAAPAAFRGEVRELDTRATWHAGPFFYELRPGKVVRGGPGGRTFEARPPVLLCRTTARGRVPARQGAEERRRRRGHRGRPPAGSPLRQQGGAPQAPRADRKSTRLNSSHANISYAVFCLKKK